MKLANIVVLKATGDGCSWAMVEPALVPDLLKEPEVMGEMVRGYIIEHEGQFYRAQKLADSNLVLAGKKAVIHKRPRVIQ